MTEHSQDFWKGCSRTFLKQPVIRHRIRIIWRPLEIYLCFSNPNTYHTDYISGNWEQQSDHSLWPYWIKSERDSIYNSCDDFQLDIPITHPSLPILRPSKNKCCVNLMSSCIDCSDSPSVWKDSRCGLPSSDLYMLNLHLKSLETALTSWSNVQLFKQHLNLSAVRPWVQHGTRANSEIPDMTQNLFQLHLHSNLWFKLIVLDKVCDPKFNIST